MIRLSRRFAFSALEDFNRAFTEATQLPRFAEKELDVAIELHQASLIYAATTGYTLQVRAGTGDHITLTCGRVTNQEFKYLTMYTISLKVFLEKQDYMIHFINFILDGTLPPTKD